MQPMSASAKMPVEAKPFPPGQECCCASWADVHLTSFRKGKASASHRKKNKGSWESLETFITYPIIVLLPWFPNARLIWGTRHLNWSTMKRNLRSSFNGSVSVQSNLGCVEAYHRIPIGTWESCRVMSLRSSLDITSFHFPLQPKHRIVPCDRVGVKVLTEWNYI